MSQIRRMPGITDDEVKSLKEAGIQTTDELWRRAIELEKLAKATHLSSARLAALLSSLAKRESAHVTLPRLRHIGGFVWHLALVGCIALSGIAAAAVVIRPVERLIRGSSYVVSVGSRDLRPYAVIGQRDLVRMRGGRSDGAFTRTEDVVGRYAMKTLVQGTILRPEHVSQSSVDAADLAKRTILSLPIASMPVIAPQVPFKGTLYASPGMPDSRPSLTVSDVVVLALRSNAQGAFADVAMEPSAAQLLGAVLATSRVSLAHVP